MTDTQRPSVSLQIPSRLPPDPLVTDYSGHVCRWVATVEVVMSDVATADRRMATHRSTMVRYLPSRRAGQIRECHYRRV
jgi:hypothetical protein